MSEPQKNNKSINVNSDEATALRLQNKKILEADGVKGSKTIATLSPTCRGSSPFHNNFDSEDRDNDRGAASPGILV